MQWGSSASTAGGEQEEKMGKSEKWKTLNSKWSDSFVKLNCRICYWTDSGADLADSTLRNSSANVLTIPAKSDTSAVLKPTLCWGGEWQHIKKIAAVWNYLRDTELKEPSVLCNCGSNLMLWLSSTEEWTAFHVTSARNTSTGQELQIWLEMMVSWTRHQSSAE